MTRRQMLDSAFSAAKASLFVAIRSQGRAEVPEPYKIAEAYQIYSTILTKRWLEADLQKQVKVLVIRSTAIPYKICFRPYGEWEKALSAAVDNYSELAKSSWLLESRFDVDRPYKLVPDEALSRLLVCNKRSIPFNKAYPDSGGRYFAFSPVGFNQDRTLAVAHAAYICGSLCGMGQFYVLHKRGDVWSRVEWRSSCLWVS